MTERGSDPTSWFEPFYIEGGRGEHEIPWDSGVPQPLLVSWVEARNLTGKGKSALVVGCGFGQDAEYVASLGFAVTAFDVAPTAIAGAKERHPDSPVEYLIADLFNPPAAWRKAFDFVFECYTVQALPIDWHAKAAELIGTFVRPGGQLLMIGSVGFPQDNPENGPPWPLKREELDHFAASGLQVAKLEQMQAPDNPRRQRWRVEFGRPEGAN